MVYVQLQFIYKQGKLSAKVINVAKLNKSFNRLSQTRKFPFLYRMFEVSPNQIGNSHYLLNSDRLKAEVYRSTSHRSWWKIVWSR